METVWIWALGLLGLLGCLSAAALLLLALLLKRPQYQQEATQSLAAQTQANMALLTDRLEQLNLSQERQAKDLRQELLQQLTMFQQTLLHQSAETTRTQNAQIDAFGQQLALMRANLSDTLAQQINAMSEANARRLGEMRATLEAQL
ncbi:MAG: DNA recombination protein RmuC, partial [Betaproteobacteria bacterium]|nr:DNA recombination protein RmuC [Betaproteobacteria bacterium]